MCSPTLPSPIQVAANSDMDAMEAAFQSTCSTSQSSLSDTIDTETSLLHDPSPSPSAISTSTSTSTSTLTPHTNHNHHINTTTTSTDTSTDTDATASTCLMAPDSSRSEASHDPDPDPPDTSTCILDTYLADPTKSPPSTASTLSISPSSLDPATSPLLAPFLTSPPHISVQHISILHYDTCAPGATHVLTPPVLAVETTPMSHDIEMSHESEEGESDGDAGDGDEETSEDGMTTSTSSVDSKDEDPEPPPDIPTDWSPPTYEEWFTQQCDTLSQSQRQFTLSHLTKDIATREDDLRQQLITCHATRDHVLHQLVQFRDHITARREYAARSSRAMEAHATHALRHLKHIDTTRERQLRTIRAVEETRRKMVTSIKTELKWDRPHHYHLTALDHYMGHTQPSLMEIGCMIRGHLRVCAVAHQLIARQRKMTSAVVEATAEREKESQRLNDYEKSISHHQRESHELTRLADVLSHRYGTECDRYQQRHAREHKPTDEITSPLSSAVASVTESITSLSIGTTQAMTTPIKETAKPAGYLDIKKRYFQSINVNQHSTSPTSTSPTETPVSTLSLSPGSSAQSSVSTSPTATSSSTLTVDSSTTSSRSPSPTPDQQPALPGSLFSAYWYDLQSLANDYHQYKQQYQHIWEQLEMVLDRRERIKHWDVEKENQSQQENNVISPTTPATPSKSRFAWLRLPTFRRNKALETGPPTSS